MNNPNLDSTWDNDNSNKEAPVIKAVSNTEPSFVNDQPIDPFEEARKKTIPSPQPIQTQTDNPTDQMNNQETAVPIIKKINSEEDKINFPPKIEPKDEQNINQPNKSKSPILKNIGKLFLIVIGILVFVYLFVNVPALFSKAEYQINPPQVDSKIIVKAENAKSFTPGISDMWEAFFQMAIKQTIKNLPPAPEPPKEEPKPVETPVPASTPKKTTKSTSSSSTTLGNNSIYIAKIGIKAPIVWNSPVDEQTVLDNLHNGVVHYAGTPLPGEGKGPIFISGHSSYYWWDKGAYKKIFATLNNVDVGDNIVINYEGTIYTYQVFDKIVVSPDQVDVLNQVNEPILDVMTCVPVGTNQNRLIVKAKQI